MACKQKATYSENLQKNDFKDIIEVIGYSAGLLVAIFGAMKAFIEVPEFVNDLQDWHRNKPYRIRTSIVKAIIDETQTELIKLRTIRANKRLSKITLDSLPTIILNDGKNEILAPLKRHFSVPGRTIVDPENRLEIDFMKDEELAAHKFHSLLLSYVIGGTVDQLWDPPGIIAQQPVGSGSLVIEVYFPNTRLLRRDDSGKPKNLRVYTVSQTKEEKDISATTGGYRLDFSDGRGSIDWIRAVIMKPPQDLDIRFDWQWDMKS